MNQFNSFLSKYISGFVYQSLTPEIENQIGRKPIIVPYTNDLFELMVKMSHFKWLINPNQTNSRLSLLITSNMCPVVPNRIRCKLFAFSILFI